MKELTIVETQNIIGGGISVSGAFLSSIKGCITVIFEIGQTVGGAIRRIVTRQTCSC